MKKNRYSKTDRKEVPSRRKLARVAELLEVEVEAIGAQMAREKAELRGDLSEVRQTRDLWRGRAESMREECEKLRKQVEGMLPSDEFVKVMAVPGSWNVREMMMRDTCRVEMPRYHVGVDVAVHTFERMDRGERGAFVEALADRIGREAREAVMRSLVVRG